MNLNGWSVARFWNTDVLLERGAVLETIVAVLDCRIAEPCRSRDFAFLPSSDNK